MTAYVAVFISTFLGTRVSTYPDSGHSQFASLSHRTLTDCPGSVNVFIIMINPTLYSSTRQWIIHQHLTMFSLSFVLFSPKSGSTQYWLRLAQYSSRHRTDSPIMRSTAVHIFSQHWHWLAIIASQAAADSSYSVPRLYCVQATCLSSPNIGQTMPSSPGSLQPPQAGSVSETVSS